MVVKPTNDLAIPASDFFRTEATSASACFYEAVVQIPYRCPPLLAQERSPGELDEQKALAFIEEFKTSLTPQNSMEMSKVFFSSLGIVHDRSSNGAVTENWTSLAQDHPEVAKAALFATHRIAELILEGRGDLDEDSYLAVVQLYSHVLYENRDDQIFTLSRNWSRKDGTGFIEAPLYDCFRDKSGTIRNAEMTLPRSEAHAIYTALRETLRESVQSPTGSSETRAPLTMGRSQYGPDSHASLPSLGFPTPALFKPDQNPTPTDPLLMQFQLSPSESESHQLVILVDISPSMKGSNTASVLARRSEDIVDTLLAQMPEGHTLSVTIASFVSGNEQVEMLPFVLRKDSRDVNFLSDREDLVGRISDCARRLDTAIQQQKEFVDDETFNSSVARIINGASSIHLDDKSDVLIVGLGDKGIHNPDNFYADHMGGISDSYRMHRLADEKGVTVRLHEFSVDEMEGKPARFEQISPEEKEQMLQQAIANFEATFRHQFDSLEYRNWIRYGWHYSHNETIDIAEKAKALDEKNGNSLQWDGNLMRTKAIITSVINGDFLEAERIMRSGDFYRMCFPATVRGLLFLHYVHEGNNDKAGSWNYDDGEQPRTTYWLRWLPQKDYEDAVVWYSKNPSLVDAEPLDADAVMAEAERLLLQGEVDLVLEMAKRMPPEYQQLIFFQAALCLVDQGNAQRARAIMDSLPQHDLNLYITANHYLAFGQHLFSSGEDGSSYLMKALEVLDVNVGFFSVSETGQRRDSPENDENRLRYETRCREIIEVLAQHIDSPGINMNKIDRFIDRRLQIPEQRAKAYAALALGLSRAGHDVGCYDERALEALDEIKNRASDKQHRQELASLRKTIEDIGKRK